MCIYRLLWIGVAKLVAHLLLAFIIAILVFSGALGQPLRAFQGAGRVAPFRLVSFKDVVGVGFNERIGVAVLITSGTPSLTVIDERGVRNYSSKIGEIMLSAGGKGDVLVGAGRAFILAGGNIYSLSLFDGEVVPFFGEGVSVIKVFRNYVFAGWGVGGYILDYNGNIVAEVPPHLLVLDSWERVLALDRDSLTFYTLSDDGMWTNTALTLGDYVTFVKDFGDVVFVETAAGSLYLLNISSKEKTFLRGGGANKYVIDVEAVDGKYYIFYSDGQVLVVEKKSAKPGFEEGLNSAELGIRVSRVSCCGDIFYVIDAEGGLYVVSRDLRLKFQAPIYTFEGEVGIIIPYTPRGDLHAVLALLLGERVSVAWLGFRDYRAGGGVEERRTIYASDSFAVHVWVNPPRRAVFEVWVYDSSLSKLIAKYSGVTGEDGEGRLLVRLNLSGVFRVFAYFPPDGYFLSRAADLGEVELHPIPLECAVSFDRRSVFEGEPVKVFLSIKDALSGEDVTEKLIRLGVVKIVYSWGEEAAALDVDSRVMELPTMRPGRYFVKIMTNATEIYDECVSKPVVVEVKAWFISAQVLAMFAVLGVSAVAGLAFIYFRYKGNVWMVIYRNIEKGVDDEELIARFGEVLPAERVREAYQVGRELIKVIRKSKRISDALKTEGPLDELRKSATYITSSADRALKVYRKGELGQAAKTVRLASEKLNALNGLLSAVIDKRLKNVERKVAEIESYLRKLEELRVQGIISEKAYSTLKTEYTSRLREERRLYEYYLWLKKIVEGGSSVGGAA